jgi:hypothetical protein
MHESEILVIRSPKMSAQIPHSFAVHAFNQFQRSMHLFEIIRLGALGTRLVRTEKASPRLSNCSTSRRSSSRSRARRTTSTPTKRNRPTPTRAAIRRMLPHEKPGGRKIGLCSRNRRRNRCASSLRLPPTKAAAIQASPRLTALMDFRHAYVANNLALLGSCTDDNRPGSGLR